MTGQVDRLVVTPGRVLVLDYKTNRPPPTDPADVAPLYLRQMAAYRAVLNRDVDAGGLGFFASQLGSGGSLAGIVQALAGSPEFTARNAGLDNAAFVRSLYESAVGRTPDVGGNTFFAAALANGGSRADIAAAIAFSDEGQQAAQPFYQTGIRVT